MELGVPPFIYPMETGVTTPIVALTRAGSLIELGMVACRGGFTIDIDTILREPMRGKTLPTLSLRNVTRKNGRAGESVCLNDVLDGISHARQIGSEPFVLLVSIQYVVIIIVYPSVPRGVRDTLTVFVFSRDAVGSALIPISCSYPKCFFRI